MGFSACSWEHWFAPELNPAAAQEGSAARSSEAADSAGAALVDSEVVDLAEADSPAEAADLVEAAARADGSPDLRRTI